MAFHSNPKRYHPSNTTFVQAHPSNFRALVQRLTGAPPDPFAPKLPVTINASETGRLQERRQSGRNVEIKLGWTGLPGMTMVMTSPVSALDVMGMQSPAEKEEEEERWGIAERGFYFEASPLNASTPRSSEPPELLSLFPLQGNEA